MQQVNCVCLENAFTSLIEIQSSMPFKSFIEQRGRLYMLSILINHRHNFYKAKKIPTTVKLDYVSLIKREKV